MLPKIIRSIAIGILGGVGGICYAMPSASFSPSSIIKVSTTSINDTRNEENPYTLHQRRIDPKTLRQRQEAFITKEASLTPAEATYFFPLFRELKQKQRNIRRTIHQKFKKVRQKNLTEKDCDKLLREIESLEKQSTEFELAYYAKWKKKITSSKIIRILAADRRFSKQVFDGCVK